jgi:hypothetical protein
MAGFGFNETMSGTWTATEGRRGGGRFEFAVAVHSGPMSAFGRTRQAIMTGTVDAAGLATAKALRGTMELRPWIGRLIRYQFEFLGDDGHRYDFAGQKDIRWLAPLRTWTTLPGEIRDPGGLVVGRAATRFDLRRQSTDFVRSFRLA